MVRMNDEHEHDSGQVCECCDFRLRLERYFQFVRDDGDEGWHWGTGDLRLTMHQALLALDRIEANAYGESRDAEAASPAADAAAAIVQLAGIIEELRGVVAGDAFNYRDD